MFIHLFLALELVPIKNKYISRISVDFKNLPSLIQNKKVIEVHS